MARDQERFKEDIETFINYKTINEFFKKKKKLIFIDDLDIMSYDKGVINYLLNIDNKNIPIICIISHIRITNLYIKVSYAIYDNS